MQVVQQRTRASYGEENDVMGIGQLVLEPLYTWSCIQECAQNKSNSSCIYHDNAVGN